MKIGFVGYGSQSKRLINILKKIGYKNLKIYKPFVKKKDPNFINSNLDKIKKCDAIFICSPNKTHFKYLKIFKNKYIFCEKPIVSNLNQLKKLKDIKKERIFVNYNYRFGYLSEVLNMKKKLKLGNLIGGNIIMNQGLASKKKYIKSWRSKKKNCKLGVHEILGVHIIDLINYYFKIKKVSKNLVNLSKKGDSFDTSYFNIHLNNKAIINCMVSYFSPFKWGYNLIFENGIINMDQKSISVQSPRNSFNKYGHFIDPPIIYKKKFSKFTEYEYSLTKSIKFFIYHVEKKKFFNKKLFKTSINSNKFFLE